MSSDFLVVENLSKRFGGLQAVDNVCFRTGRHEMVGLIGPNGAGKTTLVRLIMGILKADSGKITLRGQNLLGKKTWKIVEYGVTSTFQNVRPFAHLPIIANVMVPCLGPRASKRGEWVKKIEARAMDALEFAGIADLAREPASRLSEGDLKRLEVARAIACDPELLILDEPFGGLNPAETGLMAKSLQRLHKGGRFGRLHSEGPAMIIIEHKLSELMRIVDRVIVLNFGQVIATGTPEEIVNNPQVIEAYIGKEVV
ncbi:MAG: ABC transporter ATP-binding protein [Dethiobacter sp.]|jgi:branched-chain amino acid transport system ATP-binding protein|nr:ABC transporter ATP-binding protein [Dethiobacter sp.]